MRLSGEKENLHCEERSDAAIQSGERRTGLLCCARNDEAARIPVILDLFQDDGNATHHVKPM